MRCTSSPPGSLRPLGAVRLRSRRARPSPSSAERPLRCFAAGPWERPRTGRPWPPWMANSRAAIPPTPGIGKWCGCEPTGAPRCWTSHASRSTPCAWSTAPWSSAPTWTSTCCERPPRPRWTTARCSSNRDATCTTTWPTSSQRAEQGSYFISDEELQTTRNRLAAFDVTLRDLSAAGEPRAADVGQDIRELIRRFEVLARRRG